MNTKLKGNWKQSGSGDFYWDFTLPDKSSGHAYILIDATKTYWHIDVNGKCIELGDSLLCPYKVKLFIEQLVEKFSHICLLRINMTDKKGIRVAIRVKTIPSPSVQVELVFCCADCPVNICPVVDDAYPKPYTLASFQRYQDALEQGILPDCPLPKLSDDGIYSNWPKIWRTNEDIK